MSQKPKLETVAKKAGVSIATVSQVMRGTGRISDKTRKKVLAAAESLHYVPDGRAASMRSGDVREIGMIIHRIANPFNAEVVSGVSDALEAEGYLVSILDSQDDPERQKRNLEAFIRSKRGGLLWVPAQDTPNETVEMLQTHRIPTVTFLRKPGVGVFDHVGILNEEATRTATEHLADLGHTHIAYFGGLADAQVRHDRIKGYKQVLEERDLSDPIVWDAPDDKVSGMNAMLELREKHPEVTAIVCNGDVVALGACHALRRLGEQPGKEVSVIGFDDIQDASVATPPLTTMAVCPYQLGKKLAQVLLARLHDPNSAVTSTFLPANLVVRETTALI
jgi:DNA-binding LacI/PurR family transcriptional regulator